MIVHYSEDKCVYSLAMTGAYIMTLILVALNYIKTQRLF